jgi:putative phosphoesterase
VKLGLISDTHGFLDPHLPKIFRGVDHILHAGDIGPDHLIAQLESIAPVTAARGNNDNSPCFPSTQWFVGGELKFLVHHIVTPRALTKELQTRLAQDKPDVVVFGHSHQQFEQRINGVLFVNPGYAGKARFGQARSVALLDGKGKELEIRFVRLAETT